jgi:hypothetical protein
MLKTGLELEFAPIGVPHQQQAQIKQLLPSEDLRAAYLMGQVTYRTSDIVLVVASHDPELISAFPRFEYVKSALKNDAAKKLARIASESAHQVAKLPTDMIAFWLVIEERGAPFPFMCVLNATPYEIGSDVEAPAIQ